MMRRISRPSLVGLATLVAATLVAATLVAAALVAAALGAPANAAAAPAAARTYLFDCSTLTQRPRQIVLTCADANLWVNKITWAHWSSATATATGTLHWNTCTPTCVAGKEKTATIHFSATGRRRVRGRWLYTALTGQKNTWRTGSATFRLPTTPL